MTTGTGARLVLTVGVHASASTWVFNMVRELLGAAFGCDRVAGCFAAKADDVTGAERRPGQHLVVKTHGWPQLPAFARAHDAAVIVSIRDPRDAVLSVMQRFGDTLDASVAGIWHDCACARACAEAEYDVLRYEDRFFDDTATVPRTAARLGVAVPQAAMDRIFAAYATAAVRAMAASVAALPPQRRRALGARLMLDEVTRITSTHIGDGRVGKWREAFDAATQKKLTEFFGPFLFRFGYPPG